MNRKLFFTCLSFLVLGLLVSCNKEASAPVLLSSGDAVVQFGLSKSSEFGVLTKSTVPAASIISFKAAATVGTAGSESSSAWVNTVFTDDGEDIYKASPAKYWPVTNPSYHFYAVGASESTAAVVAADAPDLVFAAGGSTVSMAAGYDKDVVCAYYPYEAGSYKRTNELEFEHIFARVAGVTVTADDDCSISGVTVSIVNAKTGGTYNIRTGAGATDGTGWSGLLPDSGDISVYSRSSAIVSGGSDATGSLYDDSTGSLYLVPGSYYLKATWTASVDDYTQTYSAKTSTAPLVFVKGMVNTISCKLTGDASELDFSIVLNAWGTNGIADIEFDHS